MLTNTFLVSALLSAASAHQVLQQLWINGDTPGLNVGIRLAASNSPITDIKSDAMACNILAPTNSAVKTLEAKAGDSIKVQWSALIHIAPVTHFLKPVKDAATDSGTGDGWFKIDELDFVGGKWASDIMKEDNLTREFKLPDGLPSGEYLLRSEMLALHLSNQPDKAEFYVGCAQLKVAGTDSGTCGPTIQIPGSYVANDETSYVQKMFDGYDKTMYKAPGGELASCGGSEGGAPTAPSTPQPANSTVAVAPSPIASPVVEATPQPAPVEPVAGGEAPASSPIVPQSSPVTPSVPAPPVAGNEGSVDVLPATFSLDTFIAWVKSKIPGSKARRHARAF